VPLPRRQGARNVRSVAVFPHEKNLRLIDEREPALGSPTDVKLRMLEIGICGTDREVCSFEYGTPPDRSPHLVIGHESLGEVVDVGSGVSTLRPGDLVVPMVRRPCEHAHCTACRAGRQDFCYTGEFRERGIKGLHGFMTEFVVDDESYMVAVPQALRDAAVLVEPLTIAEKALMQIFQVQQRLPWACPIEPGRPREHCHSAVVLGAGPVGLLGAMALAANGFEVFVYSRDELPTPKAALVESFGARYVSSTTHSVEDLRETVGNIDVIYEASGASAVAFEMMRVLGTNGIYVFTGVPGRKMPTHLDTDFLMRNLVLNNQVVFGTVNAGREAFESAVRDLGAFVESWPQAVRSLITGRFPIEAHCDLLLGRPQGIKNVVAL
jgi:threonine dehydrogenase-like Zn-dependent dehydrogenase